jgi:hypothetical protein
MAGDKMVAWTLKDASSASTYTDHYRTYLHQSPLQWRCEVACSQEWEGEHLAHNPQALPVDVLAWLNHAMIKEQIVSRTDRDCVKALTHLCFRTRVLEKQGKSTPPSTECQCK